MRASGNHETDRAVAGSGPVWITIALCFVVAVLEGFDIQALGVAAPRLAPELGLDPGQMGWLFAVSSIGIVVGASIGGRIADRFGRKPVFIGSVAVFGGFTLAMTAASSYEWLVTARALAGLGFGAAIPNMMAVAIEVSSPARRSFTAAAMFCGMPLGGGASALATQVLPPDFDWRTLFQIGGILPLLLVPAIWFWMEETYRPDAHVSVRGGAASALRALFGEGRAVTTLLLWLMFLPTMLILYLILNWLPTLVAAKGLDGAIAPQASMWFNLASVAGGLTLAPLVDRHGYRWPVTLAFVGLVAALLGLAAAESQAAMLWLSGAAGFFVLGANYSFYGVAAACYPIEMRGTGSGASVAVGRVGSVIGPLLAGLLMGQGTSATSVILYLVPCAALAGLAVLALSYRGSRAIANEKISASVAANS